MVFLFYITLQMTPINLVRHNSLELQQFGGDCVDDSLSMDTQDIIDQPTFTSITEIAVSIILKHLFVLTFK
jgi:glycerophosphocholine phosphodiesterase GPCPD1